MKLEFQNKDIWEIYLVKQYKKLPFFHQFLLFNLSRKTITMKTKSKYYAQFCLQLPMAAKKPQMLLKLGRILLMRSMVKMASKQGLNS